MTGVKRKQCIMASHEGLNVYDCVTLDITFFTDDI